MTNSYNDGSLIRVRGTFVDHNGLVVHPSAVRFTFIYPSEITETFIYGTDPEIVWDATGTYHMDVDVTGKKGLWVYYLQADGAIIARSDEMEFVVE